MTRLGNRIAQKKSTAAADSEGDAVLLLKSKVSVGRAGKFYTLLNADSVELGRWVISFLLLSFD